MFLSYLVIIASHFLVQSTNCLEQILKGPLPLPVFPSGSHIQSSRCGGTYEEQRICGPACPPTCDTLKTNICCDVKCIRGCFCRDGYMLLSNRGPRKCVPINECPKPGVLEFGNLTVTVLESTKMVVIMVLRLNGTAGEITVKWHTIEDSAKESSDFVPASGVLVFPDGVAYSTITIEIVDDSIREADERFTVVLSHPTHRAEINPRRLEGVTVIIKDDDMRPGYVEVLKNSISVPESYGTVIVTLVRLGGVDGIIKIPYKTVDGTAGAQIDYVPLEGVVVFNEGETRRTIQVSIINDQLREPEESFQLQFYEPSSAAMNFRQLSSSLATIIIITDDDMTPGYIELEQPTMSVMENIGTVNVNLVRLGGSDGQIKIRYRTADGTTRQNTDYVPIVGDVVFDEGEINKVISLKIIDDDLKEPVENFKFQLFDPSAAPGVINFRSLGNKLESTITIIDDDMKPGYIALPNPVITIPENVGTFKLNVVRIGGQDGEIRIRYKTVDGTAIASSDYKDLSGELVFKDGVTLQQIQIDVLNDFVTEARENFRIELFDPTAASDVINFRGLGDRSSTIIMIVDDDMKPGYLELEQVTTSVRENYGTLQVSVVRLEGTDGILQLKYRTKDGTATSGSDYKSTFGDLVFKNGEKRKTISIPILNDNIKETAENFHLQIYDITPGAETINFRSAGSKLSTLVTILDDDRTPGYLEMENPTMNAPESIGTINIPVKRYGGSDGELRVKYITTDATALAESDYKPSSGILVFNDGEIRKMIAIPIINDLLRETVKTFQVQLIDLNPDIGQFGFRSLGATQATRVSIIDDDEKPGLIEFERKDIVIREDAGIAEITVLRVGGTDGTLPVKYKTVPGTAIPTEDFALTEGELVFLEGVNKLAIRIKIVDDQIKEPTENFNIVLYEPNGLQTRRLGQITSLLVSITDNDRTPGYLEMEAPTVNAVESIGAVMIPVKRYGGSDGELRVKYITADATALAESDYKPTSGVLVFNDGEIRKMISIPIINDHLRETMKTFQVRLVDLNPDIGQLGFRSLGARHSTTVSIIDDDEKPGLIEFSKSSIIIREDVGVVDITVLRIGGTDGTLSVKYKTVPGTAAPFADFTFMEGELLFEEGIDKLTIKIRILDDQIKEPTENFSIIMYEPSGLQTRRLGQTSSLIISITDNDNTPGVFEFQNVRLSILESVRTLSITIIRRDGFDGQVSLQIRTLSGTAIEGVDYNLPSPTVIFLDGVRQQSVHIQIVDDNIKESNEEFLVGLFNPTNGGILGTIKQCTVVIIDDDDPSVIRFQLRSGSFRESDGIAEIPVIRENNLDRKVSVYWKIEDQSARAGEDYRRSSGDLLIFDPGQRRLFIRFEIMDDTQVENEEFFDVVLMFPSEGAVLGVPSRFTVQLLDNDNRASTQPYLPSLPQGIQLSFRSQNIRVKESAGEVLIPIVRSGSLIPIRIQLTTQDGTAIGGRDYRRTRGTVTFEDGDIEVKIGIRLIDDHLAEPDETFTVVLLNPSAGVLLGVKVVTITIEDDDGDIYERRSGSVSTLLTSRPRPPPNPAHESLRPGLLTQCPANLILKTCANTCPPTCTSLFGKGHTCSLNGCIRACFCPDGLVKETESSNSCIRPSECPGAPPHPPCKSCLGLH